MPTYEYVCAKCDHQFELFQPITEKPLGVCPKERCAQKTWGKGKVKRVIGAGAGLIFKGSGFYITDYRSEQYKAAAKRESAPASNGSGESKATSGNRAASKPSPAKPDAKASSSSST